MSHLGFINDDEKRRRREEEIKESLRRKNNTKKEKLRTHNYYNSSFDEDEDDETEEIKVEKYIKEGKPIAIEHNNTSFSPKLNDESSVYKMMSVILGICCFVAITLLIIGSTIGFYKESEPGNITCAPIFNEGNMSLKCSDINSSCNCPAINVSTVCGSVYNLSNYTYYYNYTNHT